MKLSFHAWITCGLLSALPALHAQSPLPTDTEPANKPLKLDELTDASKLRAAMARKKLEEEYAHKVCLELAQLRASEAARMENVVFTEEGVTVSEPADRLLFQHEENVNSFVSIGSKFGFSRILAIHMSNPRLAMHGGVTEYSGHDTNDWNENGNFYRLSGTWGLIGDLDLQEPKAFLFRPSPYLEKNTKDKDTPIAEAHIEESALNRFETHALKLLQKGEKLVRWDGAESMHAVGAIRAEAQCLRCHDNHKAGDLLGAFTYVFTKSKAVLPTEKTKRVLALYNEGKPLAEIAKATGFTQPNSKGELIVNTYSVGQVLLNQGVVTAEMLTEQASMRQQSLGRDLGPVKKPHTAAAE